MKKIFYLVLAAASLLSCNERNEDHPSIEDTILYDATGTNISLDDLKKEWQEMVNDNETGAQRSIGNLEIKEYLDDTTGQKSYVLIAINTADNVQTAALLSDYKDGYQISNRSASCYDCGPDVQIMLRDGHWYCKDDGSTSSPCTKVSRLDY